MKAGSTTWLKQMYVRIISPLSNISSNAIKDLHSDPAEVFNYFS